MRRAEADPDVMHANQGTSQAWQGGVQGASRQTEARPMKTMVMTFRHYINRETSTTMMAGH